MAWTTPITWTASQLVDEDDLNQQVRDNLNYLVGELPKRATMWHENSTVLVGNAITETIRTGNIHNASWSQEAPADGDSFTQSCVLAAGTYTLYVDGTTGSTLGKIDWDLDGTGIATGQDWYSAGTVLNVTQTVAGVVISTGGLVTLTGTINGKNAASTNYRLYLVSMTFKQASD